MRAGRLPLRMVAIRIVEEVDHSQALLERGRMRNSGRHEVLLPAPIGLEGSADREVELAFHDEPPLRPVAVLGDDAVLDGFHERRGRGRSLEKIESRATDRRIGHGQSMDDLGESGHAARMAQRRLKFTKDRLPTCGCKGIRPPSPLPVRMVLFAKDIVETEFLSMPPRSTILEAAKAMAARRMGFVIVCSPPDNPIGIVTEWDVLAKVVAESRDPSAVRLEDVMSRTLVSVGPNDGIDRVAQLMADDGTRRVLVVKDGKMLGVIRARTILSRMRDYIDSVSAQIARAQLPLF